MAITKKMKVEEAVERRKGVFSSSEEAQYEAEYEAQYNGRRRQGWARGMDSGGAWTIHALQQHAFREDWT